MPQNKIGLVEQGLLAILGLLTLLSSVLLIQQAIVPEALHLPGITIDRLSALIALLVSGVGTVVYHFSLRYLDGEARQQSFLRWLFFTVSMAYLIMLSTHLLLFFMAWLCTSLGLHKLLTFYQDRIEVRRPARKKFLISRLGDLALLAAILLIAVQWGTLDLRAFLARVNEPVDWAPAPTIVALLVVAAALTKSAQFPFHSWLPETMESPTPVSALMHAGIINAGGMLLLRFAPLLTAVPVALLNLVVVGTVTAMLGMVAMWAQTNVKRTLAWSTVGQMGFMMIQLGLAVFPAAVLHLVGHGFYKAWAFLRTGDLPVPPAKEEPMSLSWAFSWGLIGTAVALPALALAALITGFNPLHSPGELALTAMIALAIGQGWIEFFRVPAPSAEARITRNIYAVLATAAVALLAGMLYQGAITFFAPVLGPVPVLQGPIAWISAGLPVLAFVLLMITKAAIPTLERSPAGRAFYVHALHGFYLGAVADRLVAYLWQQVAQQQRNLPTTKPLTKTLPKAMTKKVEHASTN